MVNKWIEHVKSVSKANKGKTFKEILIMAKKTYKKNNTTLSKSHKSKSHKSKSRKGRKSKSRKSKSRKSKSRKSKSRKRK